MRGGLIIKTTPPYSIRRYKIIGGVKLLVRPLYINKKGGIGIGLGNSKLVIIKKAIENK